MSASVATKTPLSKPLVYHACIHGTASALHPVALGLKGRQRRLHRSNVTWRLTLPLPIMSAVAKHADGQLLDPRPSQYFVRAPPPVVCVDSGDAHNAISFTLLGSAVRQRVASCPGAIARSSPRGALRRRLGLGCATLQLLDQPVQFVKEAFAAVY